MTARPAVCILAVYFCVVRFKVAVQFCSSQSEKEKETAKRKEKEDHWRGGYSTANNCNVNLGTVSGAVWVTQGLHGGCSLCWPKGYTQDRELSPVISQPSNSRHRVEADVRSSNADLLSLHMHEHHKDHPHSEIGLLKAQKHEKTAHTRGHCCRGIFVNMVHFLQTSVRHRIKT